MRGTQVREMVSDAVMSVDRVPHDIVEGIMVGEVDDENNGEGVSVNKNTVADQSLNQDNNSRSSLDAEAAALRPAVAPSAGSSGSGTMASGRETRVAGR